MLDQLAAMRQDAGVDVNSIFQGVGQQRVTVEFAVADGLTSRAHFMDRVWWRHRGGPPSPTRASRRSWDERGRCRSPDVTWADAGEPAADWPPRSQVAALAPIT